LIPENLVDWTYETIARLCDFGQAESETHDFKFDIRGIKDLNKLCCAFANTRGGFVIIGVKENGNKNFSIEGIEPDKELFSKFIQKIHTEPAIDVDIPKIVDIPDKEKKFIFSKFQTAQENLTYLYR
jgi:predicted HTH transcriptional regulator